jgi:hypothetical protein
MSDRDRSPGDMSDRDRSASDMSRETLGRMVTRLYPVDIRERSGDEMVGTLLDAGDASRLAHARQLGSLLRSGLSARARSELSRPLARIAASALGWVAVMSAMSVLVATVGVRLRWDDSPGSSADTLLYCYILPALILTSFTLRHSRITGVLGLVWLGVFLRQHPTLPFGIFYEAVPLQAAGFALLLLKPRTTLNAGRLLWVLPALVWLAYQVTLLGQLSGVGRITPVLAALVLLPWAPSLTLGIAVSWALTAIYYLNVAQIVPSDPHLVVVAIEFLVGVPLSLIAAYFTRRAAAREAPRTS